MAATGGSIRNVTIGGRIFKAAGDSDSNRKLGGSENEMQPNGDGATARKIVSIVPWSLSDIALEIDDTIGDLEYLQETADKNKSDFPIAIEYASGVVYSGAGTVVGEIVAASNAATASINLSGPGKLKKQ